MPSEYALNTAAYRRGLFARLCRLIRSVSPYSGFPIYEDSVLEDDCGIARERDLAELKEAIGEEFELEVDVRSSHSVDDLLNFIEAS